MEVFAPFNFELGKRYLQTFWVFLFFLNILVYFITPVIECDQNAKEKSNNWKTLLIAGILRDFFRRTSDFCNEKCHPTLGARKCVWCITGHILLLLFFKMLGLAIGQKQ